MHELSVQELPAQELPFTALNAASPRQYIGSASGNAAPLPGYGMPFERHAQLAARRAFVDLRQQFLEALKLLDGSRADWLRHQVQHAQEPIDLWLLRGAVYRALQALGTVAQRAETELRRAIDQVFPDSAEAQDLAPLFLR